MIRLRLDRALHKELAQHIAGIDIKPAISQAGNPC
jgi:hypothetical protein